jgi:hypothetical protein
MLGIFADALLVATRMRLDEQDSLRHRPTPMPKDVDAPNRTRRGVFGLLR